MLKLGYAFSRKFKCWIAWSSAVTMNLILHLYPGPIVDQGEMLRRTSGHWVGSAITYRG